MPGRDECGGRRTGGQPGGTARDLECPPPAVVLRAQLLGRGYRTDEVDAVVAQLVAELPEACPLARVIDLAELVSGGEDPAEALRRLAENAGREVKNWFAEGHDRREILEVAALGFLEGTDVRSFETLLGTLQQSAAKRLATSAEQARALWKDDSLFADRGTRADGNGLIGIREVSSRSGPTKAMVFRDEAYGRFVLEELWRTRSVAFWDAIREWLDGIAAGGVSDRVARGLAHLACTDFDEVVGSYLDPWSWGRVGWSGQVTATYVLWHMCHLRGLSPAALHTAVRWANGQDVDRRTTALLAFAGNLGVCYPTDAANRLWQLTTQSDDLRGAGCIALGCLFATLVDEAPDDAKVVLNLLDRKMESLGDGAGRGRTRAGDLARLRGVTMTAALAVVSTNSVRTQRSALFEHIDAHPDRLGLVARVCAGLFRYRPLRRQALIGFRRGLHALRDLSDDPPAEARALGAALAAATPPHERETLRAEFARLDEELRRGKQESVADVLLAYLDAISGPIDTGGEN